MQIKFKKSKIFLSTLRYLTDIPYFYLFNKNGFYET